MPGPVIANPIPFKYRPGTESVLDDFWTRVLRRIGTITGANDPQQIMGVAGAMGIPGGEASPAAKAVQAGAQYLEQKFPKLASYIKAYHGSPDMLLSTVSANPPQRQFPNPQSELGAFFTIDEDEAARFADIHRRGVGGRVYPADVPLQNPKELQWNDFSGLKDVQQARAFRAQLEAAGHDGIIVRNTHGIPIEIVSFKDVPLAQQALPLVGATK